mmetsp:Transcript_105258/g.304503  ORF Transcript_105258/g.304503 Transcript_105258/m.304503 type:complete len:105 (+) Transcript_105258:687-1001(+)
MSAKSLTTQPKGLVLPHWGVRPGFGLPYFELFQLFCQATIPSHSEQDYSKTLRLPAMARHLTSPEIRLLWYSLLEILDFLSWHALCQLWMDWTKKEIENICLRQ